MKERLDQLIRLLGLNPTQFANRIGVQRGTLQHVLSGRNEASLKIVTGINQAYPSVNLEWLLYGKGQAIDRKQESGQKNEMNNAGPGCVNSGENLIFPLDDMTGFKKQNPEKDENTVSTTENSMVSATQPSSIPEMPLTAGESGRIKEVVVFFYDGTYKKFVPDPVI